MAFSDSSPALPRYERLLSSTSASFRLGRRVKIIDGTSVSMPDTPANQAVWPQSSAQKPGCGFPLLKLVGLFSLQSGALLHLSIANQRHHDVQLAAQL